MSKPWTLVCDAELEGELLGHLFPGDHDEHGAIVAAGVAKSPRGTRLLARDLFLARDGVDYVPGKFGYRRLSAEFVNDKIRYCRDEHLAYLAIHNHSGRDRVGFSGDDLHSHERGYPALLDIIDGQPVGAVVLAENSVAGDIWTPDRHRRPINETIVLGQTLRRVYPKPPSRPPNVDETYIRQARVFGDRGQDLLHRFKVGVIGCGGAGMILVSLLSRLGIGELVVVEPERIEPSNLPRLPGATRRDARLWLHDLGLHDLAARLSTPKLRLARRIARRAQRHVAFQGVRGNIIAARNASKLTDCDFIFLAADSHQARFVFNALVHQYLIPGIQVGTKISIDPKTGGVGDIGSNVRLVLPQAGCFRCNGLILPSRLREESLSEGERSAQQYVQEVPAPSVITFNALTGAQAVTDFMLMATGLAGDRTGLSYLRFEPRRRALKHILPRRDGDCTDCSSDHASRRARGDSVELPNRARRPRRSRT